MEVVQSFSWIFNDFFKLFHGYLTIFSIFSYGNLEYSYVYDRNLGFLNIFDGHFDGI